MTKLIMRVVIQRVTEASVSINNKVKSAIPGGLLILLGIEDADGQSDIDWLCSKISNLRIFPDREGIMNLSVKDVGGEMLVVIMNLSVKDVGGEMLVVSQFTLHASTKKGNRPSYIKASKPDVAIPLYNSFIKTLSTETGRDIKTGEFGAMMDIHLINSGPVTIVIDSKARE